MTIPALPPLQRSSPTFRADLDNYFLTSLPATTGAINAAIVEIDDDVLAASGSASAANTSNLAAQSAKTDAEAARDAAQASASSAVLAPGTSATSTTSLLLSLGTKSLVIQTGKAFVKGQWLLLSSDANPGNQMSGRITDHNPATGALDLDSRIFNGSGMYNDWVVSITPAMALSEAPIDGKPYVRKNAAWAESGVAIGTITTVAKSAPTDGTWLKCDNSIYLQSSYAALFAELGFLNNVDVRLNPKLTLRSPPAVYTSVAYGNGVYVGLLNSGSTAYGTSLDGITWTARTLPFSFTVQNVVFAKGLFVAAIVNGNQVMTSPDGITWTSRTLPISTTWKRVVYGNGVFIVVGQFTPGQVVHSTDGITWAAGAAVGTDITGVDFGNGIFLTLSTSGLLYKSVDGLAWGTVGSPPVANNWGKLAYGNGVFVATRTVGSSNYVSIEGANWIEVVLPPGPGGNPWTLITFSGGLFMVACTVGLLFTLAVSADGLNWLLSGVGQIGGGGSGIDTLMSANGMFFMRSSAEFYSTVSTTAYNKATQFVVPSTRAPDGTTQFIKALA